MNNSITELKNAMDAVLKNVNMADISVYADETPIHQLIKAIQCAEEVKEMSVELEEHENLLYILVRKRVMELSKMDLWRVCSEARREGLELTSNELVEKAENNSFSLNELTSISRILSKYDWI